MRILQAIIIGITALSIPFYAYNLGRGKIEEQGRNDWIVMLIGNLFLVPIYWFLWDY
jgi:Na+-driven multidrug efflux pump